MRSVVAYPIAHAPGPVRTPRLRSGPWVFLYPALPRVHKNFEVLGEAARLLAERGLANLEIRLTIAGHENRYARWLFSRYRHVPGLRFIGVQPHAAMQAQYEQCDALVFPSRLETWGLPISEAKAHGKHLIVADLPYAHEAVGDYDAAAFFDPREPAAVADLIQAEIEGRSRTAATKTERPAPPFTASWPELMTLLTDGLN